jgi:alpha-L-fucosidase
VSVSTESKDPKGAALHAIDNDPSTLWYTWNNEREMSPPPQEIVVDMGKSQTIKAFTYLPRTGGSWGVVGQYEWQVSLDGKTWTSVASGEFANIKANPIEQVIQLAKPVNCRYFRFVGKSSVEDNYISAAELGAL